MGTTGMCYNIVLLGTVQKKKKKRFEIVESKPRAVGNKGIEGWISSSRGKKWKDNKWKNKMSKKFIFPSQPECYIWAHFRCRNRPTFYFQWLCFETTTSDNTGTFC